jgi:hypothetical protein
MGVEGGWSYFFRSYSLSVLLEVNFFRILASSLFTLSRSNSCNPQCLLNVSGTSGHGRVRTAGELCAAWIVSKQVLDEGVDHRTQKLLIGKGQAARDLKPIVIQGCLASFA